MAINRSQRISITRWLIYSLLCGALAWVAVAGTRQTQTDVLRVPELEAGFRLLYELKPAEARTQFAARQQTHPEDPLSSAAEAASYLFEEFYRQGILTSEFFLDDDRFMGEIPLKADAALRKAFFTASKRAQDLARLRLKTNPDDANALFALTISVGMQADYASMIDKKYLDSLRLIREADKFAKHLLAVAPEGADAYLTLGTTNYIIGSLPAGKRFLLRFAGIRGDKREGLKQLEMAAASGRYLRPFAKILLALAALREKKPDVARTQLTELVAEFPQNSLFASELAKLNAMSPVPPPHSPELSVGSVKGASNFEQAALTAVTAGIDAVVRVHSGQGFSAVPSATPSDHAPEEKPFTLWRLIFYGILGVLFLILLVTHPSLAIWLLINILSGSRRSHSRGGRGWGSGGFSPGGGRSGGGGASSSW